MLPLSDPFDLDCETLITDEFFEGDPGSIYVVHCPKKCSMSESNIYGNRLYDNESSICKAAIHAGVIDN